MASEGAACQTEGGATASPVAQAAALAQAHWKL
jgi:hypothetical protein